MDYVEIKIPVLSVTQGEILIAKLSEQGFESFMETEDGMMAYIPVVNFSDSLITNIFLTHKGEVPPSYEKKNIKSQNWNSKWEESFHPIVISNLCCIRASFHKANQKIKFDIVIDPKMSFGTGHHETTALMIEKLLNLSLENKKVLDMGCGTAVLAILASKMGASSVIAIDIDERSYLNSMENISKKQGKKYFSL